MIDLSSFFAYLPETRLERFEPQLRDFFASGDWYQKHGDYPSWQQAFEALPMVQPSSCDLAADTVRVGVAEDLTDTQRDQLMESLQMLHPWRKGPFDLFGTFIDTEWRSDWKWQRVQPHLQPLKDRHILDVGCGNGYHCLRMAAEGARFVLGVDPTLKLFAQFQFIKRYMPELPVFLLPMKGEDVPANTGAFDTVLSMGVLYHRRSPFDHLEELKGALISGGELVLETLVTDGDDQHAFVPPGRYAQMRNVWFLPSPEALCGWLKRLGFIDVRIVDINLTSLEEQRRTDWMRFHSLADYLDPNDRNLTIEGHPAPKRAVIVATKP